MYCRDELNQNAIGGAGEVTVQTGIQGFQDTGT